MLQLVVYFLGIHLLHDEPGLARNETDYQICPADLEEIECNAGRGHKTVWPAIIILWIASFIQGIGFTVFYTVGYPLLGKLLYELDLFCLITI